MSCYFERRSTHFSLIVSCHFFTNVVYATYTHVIYAKDGIGGQTHTSNRGGRLGWTLRTVSQLCLLVLLLTPNQGETYFSYPISIQTQGATRFRYQILQQATPLLVLTIFAYFPPHTFTSRIGFRNSVYIKEKPEILVTIYQEYTSGGKEDSWLQVNRYKRTTALMTRKSKRQKHTPNCFFPPTLTPPPPQKSHFRVNDYTKTKIWNKSESKLKANKII